VVSLLVVVGLFAWQAACTLQWTNANVGPAAPFINGFPGFALVTVVGNGNDILIYNLLAGVNDTIVVAVNTTLNAVVGPQGGVYHGFDCLVPNSTVQITVSSTNANVSLVYTTIFPGTSLMLLTINGTNANPQAFFEHLPRNITMQIFSNESLWESFPTPYDHNSTQKLNMTFPPPMRAHTALTVRLRLHYYIPGSSWYFFPWVYTTVPDNSFYSVAYYHSVSMNTSCRSMAAQASLWGEFYTGSTYICSFMSCDKTAYNSTAVAPVDDHTLVCTMPTKMPTVGCTVQLLSVMEKTQVTPQQQLTYELFGLHFEFFYPTTADCTWSGGVSGGDTAAVVILAILFSASIIVLAALGFLYYRGRQQNAYESIQH